MTASEYQLWLATLTFEQRQAVEMAVGVVMDSLLMLEGRMSITEAEILKQNEQIKYMNTRIYQLERRVGLA
jgi:hypothetical protein